MKPRKPRINVARRTRQWLLAPLLVITLAVGWRYPLIGFIVPLVMVIGMIGGAIRGRYVCGNWCPRGSFLDRVVSLVSPKRAIPDVLRGSTFRWTIVVALMGLMVYRISLNPSDIMHWGRVFWMMCLVTTGLGVFLALFLHPRAWCSFCPMGTMQNAFGGHKHQLKIDAASCTSCGLCTKACPFGLAPVEHRDSGIIEDRDCLKCSECTAACPVGALSWPGEQEKHANSKAA